MPKESRKLMTEGENLLNICLQIHMYVSGSSDFYAFDQQTWLRHVKCLKRAVAYWNNQDQSTFDQNVLQLIKTTLVEIITYENLLTEDEQILKSIKLYPNTK